MRRVLAVLGVLALAGCGGGGQGGGAGGEVTVFAAASLTESFTVLGKDFEATHPGIRLRFNFAGSSALAQQINQGAPADVFASAAPATMKQVTDAGAATGTPVVFARNTLQIAVPQGNPGKVTGLADFGRAELKIALCAEQVPCGAAAKKAFDAAGVTPRPDTLEQDVKAVLTKVSLGEVDAALVYRTDVRAAGEKVAGQDFPGADNVVNDYPIAALTKARNPRGAKAFVDYVLAEQGRAVLTRAGFSAP